MIGDEKVLNALVSSLTEQPQVRVKRIASVSGNNGNLKPAASEGDPAQAEQRRDSALTEVRATYGAALAESMVGYAEPAGALSRVTGGDRAYLVSTWSGSESERLILFERNGTGTAQWWRASGEDIGLLPWRSGTWELRDGTLIITFDRRVEYDGFLGRLRDGAIDETMQFDLKEVDSSVLRLAATGGGFSPEKLFLRCSY